MSNTFENQFPNAQAPESTNGIENKIEQKRRALESGGIFEDVSFQDGGSRGMSREVTFPSPSTKIIYSIYAKLVPERGTWEPQPGCPYEVKIGRRIDSPTGRRSPGFLGVWTCVPINKERDEKNYELVLEKKRKEEEEKREIETKRKEEEEKREAKRREEDLARTKAWEAVTAKMVEMKPLVLEKVLAHPDLSLLRNKMYELRRVKEQEPSSPNRWSWIKSEPPGAPDGVRFPKYLNSYNSVSYGFQGKRWANWEGYEGIYECSESVSMELVKGEQGVLSPDEMRYEGVWRPSRYSYVKREFSEGQDVFTLQENAELKYKERNHEWAVKRNDLYEEIYSLEKKILTDACEATEPGLFAQIGKLRELDISVQEIAMPNYSTEKIQREDFRSAWRNWQSKPTAVPITVIPGQPLPTPESLNATPLEYARDFADEPVYAYPAVTAKKITNKDLRHHSFNFELIYCPSQDEAEIINAWGQQCKEEFDQLHTRQQQYRDALKFRDNILATLKENESLFSTAPKYDLLRIELEDMPRVGLLTEKIPWSNDLRENFTPAMDRLQEIETIVQKKKKSEGSKQPQDDGSFAAKLREAMKKKGV